MEAARRPGAVGQDPPERVRPRVRSPGARQRLRDRARRAGRYGGAHLRSHLHRRQEPAHERHQGGQRGRQSRPGSDEARLPRRHREGPTSGLLQDLCPRRHRRRRRGRRERGRQGEVELRPHRLPGPELQRQGLLHLHRSGRRDALEGRLGGVHRPGGPPAGAPRRPGRTGCGHGQQGPQVRRGRRRQGVRATARGQEGIRGPLEVLHEGVPRRSADVQVRNVVHHRGGEHAEHLPLQEPHGGPVARCRYTRREEHRRQLRDPRRGHAQLPHGLHRPVQQHRPRQGR